MKKQKTQIQEVIQTKLSEKRDKKYNEYVKENTPKKSWLWNLCKAFFVGGLICVLGQMLTNWGQSLGLDEKMSGSFCSVILVLLSTLLTALNIWPYIGKFGGAGALVPITGFANSVAAPAVEYQTEGQVFGIGAKIFTIAGPVILYGILTSWALGFCYWMWLLWTV